MLFCKSHDLLIVFLSLFPDGMIVRVVIVPVVGFEEFNVFVHDVDLRVGVLLFALKLKGFCLCLKDDLGQCAVFFAS